MTHPLWPLFDLRIVTPHLELRLPADDELASLCVLAREGIHDPSWMPFGYGWTDLPSPAFERGFAQYHWGRRAEWRPEHWSLELMVSRDGEPIGMQGVFARDFPTLRAVSSGSWLGRAYQGRGLGKEMRGAVLHLAFAGLGAEVALTEAFTDNLASIGVSRAVGYEENGTGRLARRGAASDTLRFRLTRERWASLQWPEARIEGLEACLELFGATPG